jgi:hypothetical protein
VKVCFLHDAVQGGASGLDDVHTDHVRSHLDKLNYIAWMLYGK